MVAVRSPKTPANPAASLRARARKLIAAQRDKQFRALCDREGVPSPVAEFHFAKPERAWRFDYCWPDAKVALECEGGVWTQGRHARGAGMIEDMTKYNRATTLGWRVFRVTPSQLDTTDTVRMIRQALSA